MNKAILIKGCCAEAIDFPEGENHLDFYYDAIGCSCIDIVPAYGLEGIGIHGYDLIVDDEGLLVGKEINPIASFLYGYDSHGELLVGDVMICKRIETPDGMDSTGLDGSELITVFDGINELVNRHNEKVGGGGGK